MAQYRMQVALYEANDPARDEITNTFYLDTDTLTSDDVDQLCEDTVALWAGIDVIPGFGRISCTAYNMADPEPRLPAGEFIGEYAAGSGSGMPREVALCLSYYAGRNTPRLRGRMYIGPFATSFAARRPSSAARDALAELAEGISGLGGVNVQWVQYSPTTGDFTNVTNYWIDDEWDTVRSRGLRATTRTTGTVSG